jgi:hypothetical protein
MGNAAVEIPLAHDLLMEWRLNLNSEVEQANQRFFEP